MPLICWMETFGCIGGSRAFAEKEIAQLESNKMCLITAVACYRNTGDQRFGGIYFHNLWVRSLQD